MEGKPGKNDNRKGLKIKIRRVQNKEGSSFEVQGKITDFFIKIGDESGIRRYDVAEEVARQEVVRVGQSCKESVTDKDVGEKCGLSRRGN